MKHYTIPFFIPHEGCPHQCAFCDQKNITGSDPVKPQDVAPRIEEYLDTMFHDENTAIEVGFFGGSFTGLPADLQESFFRPVQEYIKRGLVEGIRLSTRPDLITEEILDLLKKWNVRCVELGVQSMSDKVLAASKRGHTAGDTVAASAMILKKGFTLGHQMMLGLPESTREDEYHTARRVRELGASQVRIYPLVVMKDTPLAEQKHTALTEEEAIDLSARLVVYFESSGIKVIRCGLHPSSGLLNGKDIVSGPFHEAFGLKVRSRIFSFMLEELHRSGQPSGRHVLFNRRDEAAFFGFRQENKPMIAELSEKNMNFFWSSGNIPRHTFMVREAGCTYILGYREIAASVLPKGRS